MWAENKVHASPGHHHPPGRTCGCHQCQFQHCRRQDIPHISLSSNHQSLAPQLSSLTLQVFWYEHTITHTHTDYICFSVNSSKHIIKFLHSSPSPSNLPFWLTSFYFFVSVIDYKVCFLTYITFFFSCVEYFILEFHHSSLSQIYYMSDFFHQNILSYSCQTCLHLSNTMGWFIHLIWLNLVRRNIFLLFSTHSNQILFDWLS